VGQDSFETEHCCHGKTKKAKASVSRELNLAPPIAHWPPFRTSAERSKWK
jgi:hypothetical protein